MNTEKMPLENENEPSCLGAVSGSGFLISETLTGKCKDDFWDLYAIHPEYDELVSICKMALLIEFFDNAKIYLNAYEVLNQRDKRIEFAPSVNLKAVSNEYFLTRIEALENGLKRANELYNL
jgi:hypothetical protein